MGSPSCYFVQLQNCHVSVVAVSFVEWSIEWQPQRSIVRQAWCLVADFPVILSFSASRDLHGPIWGSDCLMHPKHTSKGGCEDVVLVVRTAMMAFDFCLQWLGGVFWGGRAWCKSDLHNVLENRCCLSAPQTTNTMCMDTPTRRTNPWTLLRIHRRCGNRTGPACRTNWKMGNPDVQNQSQQRKEMTMISRENRMFLQHHILNACLYSIMCAVNSLSLCAQLLSNQNEIVSDRFFASMRPGLVHLILHLWTAVSLEAPPCGHLLEATTFVDQFAMLTEIISDSLPGKCPLA